MTPARTLRTTLLVVLLGLVASACGGSSSPKAITSDEAVQVRVGTSKEDVLDELGEPAGSPFEPRGPERSLVINPRRAECIYYPSTGDVPGAQGWRYCFDEKGDLFSRNPDY